MPYSALSSLASRLSYFLWNAAPDGPVLKAAATDVHRLARYTVTRPEGAAGMPDVIDSISTRGMPSPGSVGSTNTS